MEQINSEPHTEDTLKEAELKAKEHYDSWIYAKAECDTIRRRAVEDVQKAQKFAVERFSHEILAVKDSLEAGLSMQAYTVENFKNGMELTLKQLNNIFEKFNIVEIDSIDMKLDPNVHHAVSIVSNDKPVNTVINVMQKGYTLNGRVLRPAMVMVSNGESDV